MKIISYLDQPNIKLTLGRLELIILDAAVLDAGTNWTKEAHFHQYFEFHMIKSGRGFVTIEGTDLHLNPNDFYITGPYVTHAQSSDPHHPMVEYCLQCEIRLTPPTHLSEENTIDQQHLLDILSTTYPRTFTDTHGAINCFDTIIQEDTIRIPGFSLQIQTLLVSLLINLFRSIITLLPEHSSTPQTSDIRLLRIMNFIENNYHLSPSIDELSKVLFLSPKQINRLMKKHFGCTFNDQLTLHKVEKAKYLLNDSLLSTETIAEQCGFSSNYYMYQVFKRLGLPTPASFRKNSNYK